MTKPTWIARAWDFFVDELSEHFLRILRIFAPVVFTVVLVFMVFQPQITDYLSSIGDEQRRRFVILFPLLILTAIMMWSTLSRRVFLDYDPDYRRHYRSEMRRESPRVVNQSEKAAAVTAIEKYEELATSSRSLAASLYNRSGVYLVTGVCLAVGGIVTFYFMRPRLAPGSSAIDLVVSLLPGSSTLLLVELIAFFFLRQSRAVMDEFRHFDQLARSREEVLAALRISGESGRPLDVTELMAKGFYFTKSERLSSGETTEIVETRKLEKTEIDILNKVVELISSKRS